MFCLVEKPGFYNSNSMFECQDFAKHMKLLSEGTKSMKYFTLERVRPSFLLSQICSACRLPIEDGDSVLQPASSSRKPDLSMFPISTARDW